MAPNTITHWINNKRYPGASGGYRSGDQSGDGCGDW